MAGFTQPVYKIVCVKVPEGIFLCETADLHSGWYFMQQLVPYHSRAAHEWVCVCVCVSPFANPWAQSREDTRVSWVFESKV